MCGERGTILELTFLDWIPRLGYGAFLGNLLPRPSTTRAHAPMESFLRKRRIGESR
jgi:hypothetical protein